MIMKTLFFNIFSDFFVDISFTVCTQKAQIERIIIGNLVFVIDNYFFFSYCLNNLIFIFNLVVLCFNTHVLSVCTDREILLNLLRWHSCIARSICFEAMCSRRCRRHPLALFDSSHNCQETLVDDKKAEIYCCCWPRAVLLFRNASHNNSAAL